ncbi:hypothetical protein DEO72_LG5g1868 [Vigna unguiculata]|uniref:Uncharacterized protein n=1 Tax=Vigna unguiculata TaxID=3917 RepID=A0A4D6LY21_VIGUN|nr:hypothetical protein DEO72_LG5g1868 [Vigna unguiculata]
MVAPFEHAGTVQHLRQHLHQHFSIFAREPPSITRNPTVTPALAPLPLLHPETTTVAPPPKNTAPPSSHHAGIIRPTPFSHTFGPTIVAPGLLARFTVTNSKLRCVVFATIIFVQHIIGTTVVATLAEPAAATATHGTTTKPRDNLSLDS